MATTRKFPDLDFAVDSTVFYALVIWWFEGERSRDFFCCEMGRLGALDRYVDAFCGRVPKSVLARHYTDYSPKRLKRIYDRANLKVLS